MVETKRFHLALGVYANNGRILGFPMELTKVDMLLRQIEYSFILLTEVTIKLDVFNEQQ